ncbi:MAG: hypothetical protein WA637_19680 [Terriglobales bacterium]
MQWLTEVNVVGGQAAIGIHACSPRGIDRGAILWKLTGNNAVTKPGHSLLPALIILFLVSYGLLTMLVVEQGRTIESQRGLIEMLFSDSVELTGMKGKENQRRQSEAQARAHSQMKPPPAQAAPPRVPQVQSPSSNPPQAGGAKSQSTSKFARPLPQKPPKSTADQDDERRMLISI